MISSIKKILGQYELSKKYILQIQKKQKLNEQVIANQILPPQFTNEKTQKTQELIHSDNESPTTTKKIIDENIKKFQILQHSTTQQNIEDEPIGLKVQDNNIVDRRNVKSKTVQFSQTHAQSSRFLLMKNIDNQDEQKQLQQQSKNQEINEKSKLRSNKIFSKYEVNFKLLEKYADIHELKKFEDVEQEVLRDSEKNRQQQLQQNQNVQNQKKKDSNYTQSSKSQQVSRRQSNYDEHDKKTNNKNQSEIQTERSSLQKKSKKRSSLTPNDTRLHNGDEEVDNNIINKNSENIMHKEEEDDDQLFEKLEQQINNESNLVQRLSGQQEQRDSANLNSEQNLSHLHQFYQHQLESSQNESISNQRDSNVSEQKQKSPTSDSPSYNINNNIEKKINSNENIKLNNNNKQQHLQQSQQQKNNNQKAQKQQQSKQLKTQKKNILNKQMTLNFSLSSNQFKKSKLVKKTNNIDQSSLNQQQLDQGEKKNNSNQYNNENSRDIRNTKNLQSKFNKQRSLTHEYKDDKIVNKDKDKGENIIQPSTSSYFQFKLQYLPPPVDGEQLNKLLSLNSTKNSTKKCLTPKNEKDKNNIKQFQEESTQQLQHQLSSQQKSSLRNSLKNTPQVQKKKTLQIQDDQEVDLSQQNYLDSLVKQPKSVRFQNQLTDFDNIQMVESTREGFNLNSGMLSCNNRLQKSATVYFNASQTKKQQKVKSDIKKMTQSKLDLREGKLQKQINILKTSKSQMFIKPSEVVFFEKQDDQAIDPYQYKKQSSNDQKYSNLDKILSQLNQNLKQ